MKTNKWPTTVEEAIKETLALLSAKDKKEIANIPKDESFRLHMSLGMQIRNRFGLHQGNQTLLAACDAMEADGASEVILDEVLKALKTAKKKGS